MTNRKNVEWPDWENKKQQWKAQIAGQVAANMDTAAAFAAEEARKMAPERTGRLKGNIAYEVTARGDLVTGTVGVKKDAYWGYFQEMGTSRMSARPFLRPAVYNNIKRITQILVKGK